MNTLKLLKSFNTTILAIEIFLCVGGFIGFQVSFGHGLGDILYYAFLYPLTLVHFIWTIKIRKAPKTKFITPLIIFLITTIYFSLEATIWRGPENPWGNGNFFYSKGDESYVETQMMYDITNAGKTDYISVSDPGEKYVTELKTTVDLQNKELVFIDSGAIIKPDTLKRFTQNIDNKIIFIEGKNPFKNDSSLHTIYLKGQVSGIRDNRIVFYVRSWRLTQNGR